MPIERPSQRLAELRHQWLNGDLRRWGFTRTDYLNKLVSYRRMSESERVAFYLRNAAERTGRSVFQNQHDNLALIGTSPFGWHAPDFLSLERLKKKFPRMGIYGAGLNDEHAFLRSILKEQVFENDPAFDLLKQAFQEVFPPHGTVCNEPRELRLLFDGEITVFDSLPGLAEDLARPSFSRMNDERICYDRSPEWHRMKDDYWRRLIQGRTVTHRTHGVVRGITLESETIDMPAEGTLVNSIDFASRQVVADPFALSVYLEGQYFLSMPLLMMAWANVVYNAGDHEIIVSDVKLEERVYASMGLKRLWEVRNPLHTNARGDPSITSYVYEKERSSFDIEWLWELLAVS